MNLQNLDMQDIQILSLLQQKLSDEWLPTVLATLRRDLQVWNSLKNPEFRDKVVSKPPVKPASWTPAYFGLLALETDYSPADLRQDPDRTVDERFLAEASSYLSGEFERPASAWGQRSGVPSLSEAAKLALWIRSELQTGAVEAQHFLHRSGRLEIIQTAFACLYDMTGEPFVWLANLMKDAYATEAVDTAIHCLLANPLGPKLQRDSVFGLIRGRPLKDQNAILRRLNARNPEIAADVARKIHSRIQDGARQPARTDIYALTNLFEQAELTTLAQYPDRTADLWREVWEDSRKFQADVSSRLARHMERFKALQEDEAAAVHRWEQASQLHTQRSEHLARYALAVFKAGDTGKAKDILGAADTVPEVLYAKAFMAWHAREPDASLAARLAQEAVSLLFKERSPGALPDLDYLIELSQFLIEIHLPVEASRVLQTLLQLQPGSALVLSLLGKSNLMSQKHDAAVAAVRLGTALAPDDLEMIAQLAQALEAAGDWSNALIERSKILERIDTPTVRELRAFANCALQAGEPEVAEKIGEQAILTEPADGAIHALLGEAKFQLGDISKAMELLKTATQLAPTEEVPWLSLARVQQASGAPHRALESLRTASHACPDSAAIQFELGKAYVEANSPTKALSALRKAFKLALGDPEIELLLGETLNALGHFEEAARVLSFAYRTVPGNPEVALAYATALQALERWSEALSPLSSLVLSGSASDEAYFNYALVLLSLGEGISDAIEALDHVLDSQPNDVRALALLAEAHLAAGEVQLADETYQRLLESDLENEPTWKIRISVGVAKTALRLGQAERAIAVLNDAVKYEPEEAQLHVILCEAYAAAGLRDNALTAARSALSHDSSSLEMLTWFAEQAIQLGAVSEAYGALQQALELAPARSDLIVLLGKVQMQAEEESEAQETLSRLLEVKDTDPADLKEAAEILLALGDPWKAVACLENAINQQAQPVGYYQLLSQAYRQTGDADQAIATLDAAISLSPENADLHAEKATVLLAEGRLQAAKGCMDRALQLRPQDLQLLKESVHVYRAIGDFESALVLSERRLQSDPENLMLRHLAADLTRSLLQFDYAARILGKGWPASFLNAATDPGQSTKIADLLPYFCLKAEIYLQLNNEAAAAEALKEAIRIDGTSPRALATLAQLHAANGRVAEAEELLQRIWPQSEPESGEEIGADERATDQADRLLWLPLAVAAAGVGKWREGLKLLETILKLEPQDPYLNLQHAKLMVLQAEDWRTCRDLDIRSHAPDRSAVSELSQQLFEKSIAAAEHRLEGGQPPAELKRWKIRGQTVFQPDTITAQRLRALPADAGNIAALIAVLGRVGDIEGVREAAGTFPAHPEVAIQTALALRENDSEEAYRLSRTVLATSPDDPRALALSAQMAARAGKLDWAVEAIEAALRYWPDETHWHAQAGRWIERRFRADATVDLQDAVAHMKEAVDLEGQNVSYRLDLGRLYLAAGDIQSSIRELKYAAGLEHEDHEIQLALAAAYQKEQRYEEATAAIEKAMALAPEDLRCHQVHASIALEQGLAQDALDRIGAALRVAPEDPESFLIEAKAYEALKRPSEAIQAIQKALSHSSQPLPLLLHRVSLLEQSKGRPAALKALEEIAEGFASVPEVQQRLAGLLALENRPAEAILAAKQALRLGEETLSGPERAELHITLGRLLRSAGQQDQAIHHLSEAVRLKSHSLEPYLELGRTYIERREFDAAVSVYQKAIRQSPEDARVYYQAGLALKERKDYLEAEEMLRRAAELEPNDLSIHRQLGAVVALNIVHNNGKATIGA